MVEFSTWVGSLSKITGGLKSKRLYVRLADGSSAYTEPGHTENDIVSGDDARLSDARKPTSHAATHTTEGDDPVKLDGLAAPDDTTTLDASSSAHGLLPKLSGDAQQYLNGQGQWAIPSGTTSGHQETTEIVSLYGMSVAANPPSPYAPEKLSGNFGVHISELDHDLTIDTPENCTFAADGRSLVVYKITVVGAPRKISMGDGFALHTGVLPTLVARPGDSIEITTWTDDGGKTWAFAGDPDITLLPEKGNLVTADTVLVADSADSNKLKRHSAPEGSLVGTVGLSTKVDKAPGSPTSPAGIWIGDEDSIPSQTVRGVLYFGT